MIESETTADAETMPDANAAPASLWQGDTGTLAERSRRALLEVLKGPYLSGRQQPQLWAALRADEPAIRSRLNDLFLELVVDDIDEFAFAQKVRTAERDIPSALRTERLSFIDTAMLLVLRQLLLASAGERRVIVGQNEVYDQLAVYRDGDEATYLRNLNGAWGRMMNRFRVLHAAGEGRVEISPMIKFMVDDEQVRALTADYRDLANAQAPAASAPVDSDDEERTDTRDDEDAS